MVTNAVLPSIRARVAQEGFDITKFGTLDTSDLFIHVLVLCKQNWNFMKIYSSTPILSEACVTALENSKSCKSAGLIMETV